jgi:peptidoglycan/LPS O-acetylase OafA/YrhL
MTTTTAPCGRFETVGLFRGLAALLLASFHFPTIYFGAESPLVRHSYVLTNLFFALSGFLMMAAYGQKLKSMPEYLGFMKLRLYRLYPLHIITTGTVLMVPFLAYTSNYLLTWLFKGSYVGGFEYVSVPASQIVGDLFMLQGFGMYDSLHLNFPSWSMGSLFFCAGIFGIITYARRYMAVVFSLIAAVSFYVLLTQSYAFMGSSYDFGFVRCVSNFFFGVMGWYLWRWWSPAQGAKRWAVLMQSCALVLVLAFIVNVEINNVKSMLSPLVFVFFILAFSIDHGDFADAMRKQPALKWLEQRSYSIFMNQATILVIGHQTAAWTRYFKASPAVAIAVGTLSWFCYIALLLKMSDWTYKNIELRFAPRKKTAPVTKTPKAVAAIKPDASEPIQQARVMAS